MKTDVPVALLTGAFGPTNSTRLLRSVTIRHRHRRSGLNQRNIATLS